MRWKVLALLEQVHQLSELLETLAHLFTHAHFKGLQFTYFFRIRARSASRSCLLSIGTSANALATFFASIFFSLPDLFIAGRFYEAAYLTCRCSDGFVDRKAPAETSALPVMGQN